MALERNPAIETDPFRGSDDAIKQQAKIDFMRRRNADRVKRLLNRSNEPSARTPRRSLDRSRSAKKLN